MKKFIQLFLIFFLYRAAFAETYRSEHFIVYSDLDPRFIKCLQANIEAYYNNLAGKFFPQGWSKPLEIYYSKNSSETFKLLRKDGHKKQKGVSCYILKAQTIYTNPYSNLAEFGVLFHEITHHFIHLNYPDVPSWFNEGLATFFGDESKVVKGKVTLGLPNRWRDYRLKEQLDKNIFPDIRRLYTSNRKQFRSWPIGYHFSRAFFCWLYDTGQLDTYLKNAKKDGYDISVLKNTLHKPVIEINRELLAFIKKDCYAGAYVYQSRMLQGQQKKMRC